MTKLILFASALLMTSFANAETAGIPDVHAEGSSLTSINGNSSSVAISIRGQSAALLFEKAKAVAGGSRQEKETEIVEVENIVCEKTQLETTDGAGRTIFTCVQYYRANLQPRNVK